MAINQYSPTPASNDLANYFQTGMAPSKVKNAGWDIMADLADYIVGGYTTGGSANAQTLTQTRPLTALVTGLRLECIPGFTNTGAMTFAPDGLTAKNVFANGVAAIAGMVVSGVPMRLFYDGTQWNLLNPQRSTGSFTISLTGETATTTGTINYAINADGKTFSAWNSSAITGTSNSAAMQGTGVAAVLTTGTSKAYACAVVDNNTANNGIINTGFSTTWTFYKGANSSGFTTSGTKGLGTAPPFSFVGSLD